MLTWLDLHAVAEPVWLAWGQLQEKVVRPRYLGEFWFGSGLLPRSVALSGGCSAGLRDTWDPATGYDAVAEIGVKGRASLVAFHFTTMWEADRRSSNKRNAERRERLLLEPLMREAWEKLHAARSIEEWDAVTKRYRLKGKRYQQLVGRDYPHALRKSTHVKRALSVHRAGETELHTQGFPILLSDKTTLDEIKLKMALLAFRRGVLDERELADEMKPVVRGVTRLLHIRAEDAREVLSAAAMSERGLGYIGDLSPMSFRAYLRSVLLSIRRERGKLLAAQTALAAAGEGRARRVSPVPPTVAPDGGSTVTLPTKSQLHPWAEGGPALLSRLAIDFKVDPRVASRWARDGRFEIQDCRRREEWTALDRRAAGTIEIPASEQSRWEELCARWHNMRARKTMTAGATPTEKKKVYRAGGMRGGGREHAVRLVRELAQEAGLLSSPAHPSPAARREAKGR